METPNNPAEHRAQENTTIFWTKLDGIELWLFLTSETNIVDFHLLASKSAAVEGSGRFCQSPQWILRALAFRRLANPPRPTPAGTLSGTAGISTFARFPD
jgi:hypothetical protein